MDNADRIKAWQRKWIAQGYVMHPRTIERQRLAETVVTLPTLDALPEFQRKLLKGINR